MHHNCLSVAQSKELNEKQMHLKKKKTKKNKKNNDLVIADQVSRVWEVSSIATALDLPPFNVCYICCR